MMTRNGFSALVFAFLFLATIHTHSQNLEWAKSVGSTENDRGNSITTDASGNVYVTGTFEGTVDFDPGNSTFNLTSNGLTDIFIQKLDGSGNFIWAISMGGALHDNTMEITIDASGDVYIVGYYKNTVDFDPGAATFNMTSNGDYDIFILKLDGNGNFVWAKSMGAKDYDQGNSITTDAYENVYITGIFNDTVDFDPGASTFYLYSIGVVNAFVQKLDGNGNFIWAKSMGGTFRTTGHSVNIDVSGNVYVTGMFHYTVDFDPGASTFNLTSIGAYDVFIQKLDSGGNFIWAKSFGGFLDDYTLGITFDNSGNVYTAGYYSSTVDFNPGTATFNMTSNGFHDVFVEKLDANGNFIWAKSMGGASSDEGFSITTDALGKVYVTGYFTGTADFNPGAATFNLMSNGSRDIFILKLDGNGNFVWAKSIGGIGGDDGISATTYGSGIVYITGAFSDTVDFNPSVDTFNLMSKGSRDAFILKLSQLSSEIIEENSLFNSASIFPNPSQGLVTIDLGDLKEASLKVFSTSGQIVYQKENIIGPTYQFELNAPSGFYILELTSQGERRQFKLVRK